MNCWYRWEEPDHSSAWKMNCWYRWEEPDHSSAFRFSSSIYLRSIKSRFKFELRRSFIETSFRSLTLSKNIDIKTSITPSSSTSSSHGASYISLERQEWRYLLSGGSMGSISVFDLDAHGTIKKPIATSQSKESHRSSISSVQWYPIDSGAFISSSCDGELALWDTNAFESVWRQNMNATVYKSKLNSDGTLVAVALGDKTIKLCDLRSGDSSHVLEGHDMSVTYVDWCPIMPHVIASSSLGEAYICIRICRYFSLNVVSIRLVFIFTYFFVYYIVLVLCYSLCIL
jgi:WD40 repeat protein